jgi:hypothetical protein
MIKPSRDLTSYDELTAGRLTDAVSRLLISGFAACGVPEVGLIS